MQKKETEKTSSGYNDKFYEKEKYAKVFSILTLGVRSLVAKAMVEVFQIKAYSKK